MGELSENKTQQLQHYRSRRGCLDKLAKLYLRHEVKVLYLLVSLYLCAGAFLFSYLEELSPTFRTSQYDSTNHSSMNEVKLRKFEEPKLQTDGGTSTSNPSLSFDELRQISARRMWNITNQLNILYESNWTKLILNELAAFEVNYRNILEAQRVKDECADELMLGGSRKEEARMKSLKKWMLHSLATISTISKYQNCRIIWMHTPDF